MELYFTDDSGGYIVVDYGMSTMTVKDVIDLMGVSRPAPNPPPEPMEYGVTCSLGGG